MLWQTKMPDKYRRWQEMEIKHGRIAMAAVLHVIVTGAGYKWSGYCSYLSFPPLKFDDIPAGTLGALATRARCQRNGGTGGSVRAARRGSHALTWGQSHRGPRLTALCAPCPRRFVGRASAGWLGADRCRRRHPRQLALRAGPRRRAGRCSRRQDPVGALLGPGG